MQNKVPVIATTLDLDAVDDSPVVVPKASLHPWIEIVAIALMGLALFASFGFWSEWFTSVDQWILSICVLAGMIVALARSDWQGEQTKLKVVQATAAWMGSIGIVLISLVQGRPKLAAIACGLVLAGWCTLRIRGERFAHALSLAMVFVIPSAMDALIDRKVFDWLESVSVTVTSGLADAASESHVREGKSIVFGQGVADRFSCLGRWDSLVSFVGIALFCVLAFRRNLVAAFITISLSVVAWIAVRGAGWVAIAHWSNQNEKWLEWSIGLEIGMFSIGAILLVSLDQFFSAILEPIPPEFINTDFPLFAFLWNWMCGLPALTVNIPQREMDSNDDIGKAY